MLTGPGVGRVMGKNERSARLDSSRSQGSLNWKVLSIQKEA